MRDLESQQKPPHTIRLEDYRPPAFNIETVWLRFELYEDLCIVRSRLSLKRQDPQSTVLWLDGENLKLVEMSVNGRRVDPCSSSPQDSGECRLFDHGLELAVPLHIQDFVIESVVEIEPHKNLACEGLYKTGSMFCTQCEAESFRKITYFIDRPDVMATYQVEIEADEAKYPVLLSNGNFVRSRRLEGGRHESVWKDPFNKPSYLFALVAGDLGVLRGNTTTRSGREVSLEIYCRRGLEARCQHALESLKLAMKWDEDVYGLEYDLNAYMIVVADDFNMGAMENKGLNVFNAHYVLADPTTATDKDFHNVTAVVGHEYFHNWTGNRVTCRDWFQLSLKEGLTVFRDQEFSADIGSRAVKRIEDVIRLRTHQFAEDAGPMAHPVRPKSYVSIDNFYTLTVYEKGAEVIRMIHTLLGAEKFRRGMDLYFERHDGTAATCDDFVKAMADASGRDLTQFKLWYEQAGTPQLFVKEVWHAERGELELVFRQELPRTPEQIEGQSKHAQVIPVALGLIGTDGRDLGPTEVVEVTAFEQSWKKSGLRERPRTSLLRGFSAPVKLNREISVDDLRFLASFDSDPVARWETSQELMLRFMLSTLRGDVQVNELRAGVLDALAQLLDQTSSLDPAFVSFMLQLPAEAYVQQFLTEVDPDQVFQVHSGLQREISRRFRAKFEDIYNQLNQQLAAKAEQDPRASRSGRAMGERALRNTALSYLCLSDDVRDLDRALRQRREAKDMTTELGALEALNRSAQAARLTALEEFIGKWKNEPLVVNKWLTIRATSPAPRTLDEIRELMDSPIFDRNNPNKIYSLLLAFARFNQVGFHQKSGAGYRFIADQVLDIDARNPQVASRLVSAFNSWRTYRADRREFMESELRRILAQPSLSANVREIVEKALAPRA